MKRKIVVTGISSAIIRKLFLLIDLSEYEVIGISRNPASIKIDNIKIIKGDLRNPGEISKILQGCYMVIHGAAVTHSRDEKEYYKINLDATKSLVDAANKYNVERFIFVSTNTAGKQSGSYGLTKLLAEEYIQQDFNYWTIFRLSEVYGGSKNEGIEKLIHDLIDKSFTLCPSGIPSKFYPIYIDDCVRLMHNRIFDEDYQNKISVINGPEGFSYQDIIELIQTISKRKLKVIYLNKRLMYFIKTLVKIIPVNVGIVPDQIDRLYSIKSFEKAEDSLMKMQTYIAKLIQSKI